MQNKMNAIKSPEIKEAEEKFYNFLKEGNNRITPERFEVLDAAVDFKGHFGADDLFIALKNKKSRVSRATVYNTLELLSQCGVLVKRNFGDNLNRYESASGKKRHDHLVCVNCGKIIEFSSSRLQNLINEISKENKFEVTDYSFNIFGMCDVCRKQ